MAKRIATNDLNHENWDREEDPEEAGSFSKASDDVLKQRVIKVAKRRNPVAAMKDNETKSVFGGFEFSKSSSNSPFGFLSNLAKESKTNGESSASDSKSNDDYYAKLKGLNESVLNWIKQHVTKNPFINLQPIFKDYERYFEELEKPQSDEKPSEDSTKFSFSSNTVPTFNFGSSQPVLSMFSAPNTSPTSTVTVSDKSSTFSFGAPNNLSSTKFPSTQETKEEDDEEPPKVEFTPVVEDGHVFTTRCKVFVKKDGSFGDRGVGNLFLKPVPDSEKFQLIVRADTNLGNLICNFILSSSIPMQRMGKKDVMLVCLPTPETKPPPLPVLFRVKTPQDADDLLNVMEKYKK